MDTLDLKRIGGSLQQAREKAGLSVATAAELCGLEESSMRRIELGITCPSDTDVELLQGVYRLTRHKRLKDEQNDLEWNG